MSARIAWELKRLLRGLGWPGVMGLMLVVVGVAFQFEGVMPLRAHVAAVQRDADQLRAKVALKRADKVAADPAAQLSQFYDFFPDGDAMADTLERLQAAAAAENLTLDQGEYRLAPEAAGKLLRYDIVLPIKGPYPKLRRFIARALRENPSLALEGVSFSRQTAITVGVDAQVRMTLYLKEPQ